MTLSNETLNRLTYAAALVCITIALWSGTQIQATETLASLLIAGPVLVATSVLVAINQRRKQAT
ncbi:MAG: hypothetical protein Rubg2KO_17090 [Rubricoccaceae bacterium]